MKKHFYLSVLLLLTGIANNLSAQCPNYTPWPGGQERKCAKIRPCGIYIIHAVWNNAQGNYNPTYSQYSSYYDGVFIKVRWRDLENVQGQMNATQMQRITAVINLAITQGKQISIGVEAGEWTPAWVNYSILPLTNFTNITQFGGSNGSPETIALHPVPWDINYYTAFKNMISSFRLALNAISGAGDPLINHVTMIKLTGMNTSFEETRLFVEDNSFKDPNGPTCATDVVSQWVTRGYTPDLVINTAWMQMAQHIRNQFPNQYKNLVVLPDPKAFPPIKCNGDPLDQVHGASGCSNQQQSLCCCYTGLGYKAYNGSYHKNIYDDGNSCSYNVTQEIINKTLNWCYPCVAINSTSLDDYNNSAYPMHLPAYATLPSFAVIGYQQHDLGSASWTDTHFADMIRNGMNHNASYIELFQHTFNERTTNTPYTYGNTSWINVMAYAHEYVYCHCTNPVSCTHFRSSLQNPLSFTSDAGTVRINNTDASQLYHYTIYDMTGRLTKQGDIDVAEGENTFDTQSLNLPPSIYVLKMQSVANSASYKLFIK